MNRVTQSLQHVRKLLLPQPCQQGGPTQFVQSLIKIRKCWHCLQYHIMGALSSVSIHGMNSVFTLWYENKILFCYWNSCSAFYLDGLMSHSVLFISDWCAQINLVYHVTILIKEIKMFWLLLQPLSRNLSQKGSWWLSFWLAIPSPHISVYHFWTI